MNVKFKGWNCKLEFGYYQNGSPAITLVDAEDGSPVAKATVNIPQYTSMLGDNQMFIKNYSENEGMLKTLVDAGVVIDTGNIIHFGHVTIPIVTLNYID